MTTASIRNLDTIIDSLRASGITPKMKLLKANKGNKVNKWAGRIKGGSSRARTGAGSRSVHQATKSTALGDVN